MAIRTASRKRPKPKAAKPIQWTPWGSSPYEWYEWKEVVGKVTFAQVDIEYTGALVDLKQWVWSASNSAYPGWMAAVAPDPAADPSVGAEGVYEEWDVGRGPMG
jgi:hypothetical protein